MNTALARTVRTRAEALCDLAWEHQECIPSDIYQLSREVSELARVLARVVEGKDVLRAFGAPGDWGYGTPIGEEVRAALASQSRDIGRFSAFGDTEIAVIRDALSVYAPKTLGRDRSIAETLLVELPLADDLVTEPRAA